MDREWGAQEALEMVRSQDFSINGGFRRSVR